MIRIPPHYVGGAALLLFLVFHLGCDPGFKGGATEPSPEYRYDAAELDAMLAASNQAVIDGTLLVLETTSYRNFFPSHPPSDNSLVIWIEITNPNSGGVPIGIDVDWLVAVYGNEVWEKELPAEGRSSDAEKIKESAGSGPLWPTGSVIDVIVELTSPEDGTSYLHMTSTIMAIF